MYMFNTYGPAMVKNVLVCVLLKVSWLVVASDVTLPTRDLFTRIFTV